jgi:hypothetical protein
VENGQIKEVIGWCIWHPRRGEEKCTKILVQKSEGNVTLGKPTHTWVDVKTDHKWNRKVQLEFIWLKTRDLWRALL